MRKLRFLKNRSTQQRRNETMDDQIVCSALKIQALFFTLYIKCLKFFHRRGHFFIGLWRFQHSPHKIN
jgi:hypothetical protein